MYSINGSLYYTQFESNENFRVYLDNMMRILFDQENRSKRLFFGLNVLILYSFYGHEFILEYRIFLQKYKNGVANEFKWGHLGSCGVNWGQLRLSGVK